MNLVEKALDYATRAHKNQKRKFSDIPYIIHPIEVMKRISDYGISDETLLASALLHDVKEDCSEEFSHNILTEFGWTVNSIVIECSRPEKDDATASEKYRFLQSFKNKSIHSLVIKIADRFCNVHDYLHVKDKEDYASKYALQAYPLYQTFWQRHALIEGNVISREACVKILGDIVELNIIINDVYKGFSFVLCNKDSYVKKIVIDGG